MWMCVYAYLCGNKISARSLMNQQKTVSQKNCHRQTSHKPVNNNNNNDHIQASSRVTSAHTALHRAVDTSHQCERH